MKYEIKDIHNFFKLPIEYLDKKEKINDHIKDDLEMIANEESCSIYDYLFENDNIYSKETSKLWCNYYTYDKKFLRDTQVLIKKFKSSENTNNLESWNIIKKETSFHEKYRFINISFFEKLNHSPFFLQLISIYQFISPIWALMYPILFLIVPYILLRTQNVNISLEQYYQIIKMMLSSSSIIQLFSTPITIENMRTKIYLLFSTGFYLFGIYQNIMSCINFFNNMKRMNNYIRETNLFINESMVQMMNFNKQCKNYKSYEHFLLEMNNHYEVLKKFFIKFQSIKPYNWSYHNLSNMGYAMKQFYDIYQDNELHNSIMYSFGFKGYIKNLEDIQNNLKSKVISCVKFKEKTSFKNGYYPVFKGKKEVVKNSYKLNKKIVISGPNASGKTTILKTTLFNIILSQQIGMGFYESAKLNPYSKIHCYLNIPDTSDRDSLFQAEARRCREIIKSLKDNPNGNHFCIFDELYSGTNPYEAVASAYSFITYLKDYNIDFMLTTHYVELCENLDKKSYISNKKMKITEKGEDIKYLYKMEDGISKYKGGVQVLRQLYYPKEIIERTVKYLKK